MTTNDSKSRIVSIDAARGMAMMFSCLAHFAWWIEPRYPDLEQILSSIGMVATPTFLLLSGTMTGVLCASPKGRTQAHKYRLLNRGLFLMSIGHLLISLAEAHHDGGLLVTLRGASVVDEIGLAMTITGFFCFPLADDRVRWRVGGAAAAAFALTWLAVIEWHPRTSGLRMLRQALIGPDPNGGNLSSYTAPTLQYVAIFAMGLPLGGWLSRFRQTEKLDVGAARTLLAVGAGLVSAALALRLYRMLLDRGVFAPSGERGVALTFTIASKIPPSPAYLAFYAGVGLALTGALIIAWKSRSPLLRHCVNWLAVIGRASLFVFILQYFVYWTLPDALGVRPGPFSGLLFIADVVMLWFAARWWGSVRGNRVITIGLRPPTPA